ncbi:uncharacterized protein [Diadema antillarum]|uniref:uncharacterized protein n=1 Tax=Diadema antillarum TaxID=105358 RepID=UPI003A8C4777
MAATSSVQYPSTHFSSNILSNYSNFILGGRGGNGFSELAKSQKAIRLALPTIEYGDSLSRHSPWSSSYDFNAYQHNVSRQHYSASFGSESINALTRNLLDEPPQTADTRVSENLANLPPCYLTGTASKTARQNCQFDDTKQDSFEERYADATKNSRKMSDFPGVLASPAPMYNDRREEHAKRIRSVRTVNRRDVRWYPNICETFEPNWDRTFTYSNTDVTFRERITGSPSRVVSTVTQLPKIFSSRTNSRDKYIVKWLHSVPDNNPYSQSRCDTAVDIKSNCQTPLSLKTVDSYFIDTSMKAKHSEFSQ